MTGTPKGSYMHATAGTLLSKYGLGRATPCAFVMLLVAFCLSLEFGSSSRRS